MKIIIAVTNDLVFDQRIYRVANSLYKNDYEIVLVGRKKRTSQQLVRPYKTKRFNLIINKGIGFYIVFNFRLFFYLLFHKFDAVVSNDLDTLLGSYLSAVIKRKKIIYDSHELFTEVPELVNRKFKQNIWKNLERIILPKLKNNYTVCQSIANYYNNKYKINFSVIRNLPLVKPAFESTNNKMPVLIYQGALNLGRGIELMIDAMELLQGMELWIIGTGDIEEELYLRVNSKKLNSVVKFLGGIPMIKLHKITKMASVGLSLEENLGLNYYYALPNKVFDYIQAEIPLIVANLPEMKAVVQKYGIGEVLENRTPQNLANMIQNMLTKPSIINEYKANLKVAKEELVWENEEQQLLDIYKNALN